MFRVIIYLMAVSGLAWGQDAMHFYDLGLKSTITYKKVYYFTKALELNPRLAEAYQKRGTLLYFQEKYAEAIQDFRNLAELKPYEPEVYFWLGLNYMKKDDFDEAITQLTRAIELEPQHSGAYRYRSEAYRLNGMFEDAIQDATRAIELGGSELIVGGAYTNRSKAYRELGLDELANEDFKKASRLDPEIYKYTLLTSTEFLADWSSEASRLKSLGRMGAVLIVVIIFVVIFKLKISSPHKK